MKSRLIHFMTTVWIAGLAGIQPMHASGAPEPVVYPLPESSFVSGQSTIILRYAYFRERENPEISVTGRQQKAYDGRWIQTREKTVRIWKPEDGFIPEDTVRVSVTEPFSVSWSFSVRSHEDTAPPPAPDEEKPIQAFKSSGGKTVGAVTTINGVTVPSDFPDIRILTCDNTAPGKIFFGSTFTDIGNYLVIMENDGTPCFYRRYPRTYQGSGEFRLQSTGVLTAYLFQFRMFIVLDDHYTEIDTIRAGHDYNTDPHELTILPDGHSLLIALDYRNLDMSLLVAGGNQKAMVIGNHLQELDENGTVILEWRSWDHYRITDAVHENLRGSTVDYVHMNSIAVDYDGNLIVSARHLSEITKIDRLTGEVIWRLGGVRSGFRWINDESGISYQHHVRPVAGKPGQYTVFDNGNFKNPEFTRALEFRLDPEAMTAEKVWEFRYTPDRYSNMMGSVQRLPNGNTFINWSTWPPLFACEVTSENDVVFEMEAEGTSSNRVRRFEWEGRMPEPYLIAESHQSGVALIFNQFGEHPDHYLIYGDTHPDPVTLLATSEETFALLTGLENNRDWYFRVASVDSRGIISDYSNCERALTHMLSAGENSVLNGDFSDGLENWSFQLNGTARGTSQVESGALHVLVSEKGSSAEEIRLEQKNMELVEGRNYRFEFDASGTGQPVDARIIRAAPPCDNYGKTGLTYLGNRSRHFTYDFSMEHRTDFNASVVFDFGESEGDFYIDNVSLKEKASMHADRPGPLPQDFTLEQNHPNPFNGTTSVGLVLPEKAWITLKVFDLTGRLKTRIREFRPAGRNTLRIHVSDLPSGIYLYAAEIPNAVKIRKMIIIR